jgi:hypothetical protein
MELFMILRIIPENCGINFLYKKRVLTGFIKSIFTPFYLKFNPNQI